MARRLCSCLGRPGCRSFWMMGWWFCYEERYGCGWMEEEEVCIVGVGGEVDVAGLALSGSLPTWAFNRRIIPINTFANQLMVVSLIF